MCGAEWQTCRQSAVIAPSTRGHPRRDCRWRHTRVFIDTVCQQLASSLLWQDELKR